MHYDFVNNKFKFLTVEDVLEMGFTANPKIHLDPEEKPWYFFVPPDHPSGADSFQIHEADQFYLTNGYYINFAGPARVLLNGGYEFWNGRGGLHRYDGPALYHIHNPLAKLDNEHVYYIHDTFIHTHEYLEWLDEMGMDLHNLSPEDKTIIDLKWG